MSERRTGRTTRRLAQALAALRSGESVGFLVHEHRFVHHCIGLLVGLEATTSEIDAIRFGTLSTLSRYRGWKGQLFCDHLVGEIGTTEQLEEICVMQAACARMFVFEPLARTSWQRLMGEDAF